MPALLETLSQGRRDRSEEEKPCVIERVCLNYEGGSSYKDYVVQVSRFKGTYYVAVAWGRAANCYFQQEQLKMKTQSRWQAENKFRELMYAKQDKGYRRKKFDNNWPVRKVWR